MIWYSATTTYNMEQNISYCKEFPDFGFPIPDFESLLMYPGMSNAVGEHSVRCHRYAKIQSMAYDCGTTLLRNSWSTKHAHIDAKKYDEYMSDSSKLIFCNIVHVLSQQSSHSYILLLLIRRTRCIESSSQPFWRSKPLSARLWRLSIMLFGKKVPEHIWGFGPFKLTLS